jgi:tripartite-type tricarboxylate transporter receptor subunit TctC
LPELIDWLKANPNKASAGIATASLNLVTASFRNETETQFTFVPYRGIAPAVQDLVASQIDLLFTAPDALPLMRAGSIKAYAVTSDTRVPLAPDIPTFGERGLPAVSYSGWYALFAPKDTPSNIISKLNAAAVEALADPAVRPRLVDLGVQIFPREQQTPEALGALVKSDAEKWWPIIREFGVKADELSSRAALPFVRRHIMTLPHRRKFLHLTAGAAALPRRARRAAHGCVRRSAPCLGTADKKAHYGPPDV